MQPYLHHKLQSLRKIKEKIKCIVSGGESNPLPSHVIAYQCPCALPTDPRRLHLCKASNSWIIFFLAKSSRAVNFFEILLYEFRSFLLFSKCVEQFSWNFWSITQWSLGRISVKKIRFWPIFKTDFVRFYQFFGIFFAWLKLERYKL